MNKTWLKSTTALVVASSMALLAACGGTTGGSEPSAAPGTAGKSEAKPIELELGKNGPVTIDYWHIQATIYGEAIKDIVTEFNKEYEGKIVVKEVFQGTYDDLNKKIRAALQGGGLPAVAMAYESDTLEYMKANKIVALDSFINDPKYGLKEEELKDIMPGVLDRQRISQYEGKTMSWIHGNSSMGMYYNMDLLKQAGFDKPAKTWAEFEKQALAITEKTGVPALVMTNGKNGGTFRTWLRTYGVDPIAKDLSKVNFDNPEAVQLATIIKNLVDKKAILLAENTEQEFTNGRAAMEIGTTARTSTKLDLIKDKFKWGMTIIPQGKEGSKPITELYGGNQVIFKSTPEKELAAWVFMKYFGQPKAQSIYAAKTGYFPATISSQDTELLKKNYADNPQKKQAFLEVFPHAQIDVSTAARRPIEDAVSAGLEAIISGKMPVADAMKKAQADATKALKEFQ
ncbi:ABC transporter substrate-binding protein [Paenibacillus sp. YYML68]|uniref:ABC transporter substrate-binding protein n=1 Tax=Paenibacillus sp. YYML68 TaxID=2909250 RepID=UPI002490929D|nr:ABC transporter substrate-binding protein [Paenibacillus sp. YYML68]